VRSINDFIHLSEGLSNSYLIVTDEGRIIVNTGMGFGGPIHRENYDEISTSPVRYVLFTQGHVDHVGGVDAFREPGTEIVAQAGKVAWSVRAIWEYYAGWFHARATSELYPCSPDGVSRELVRLAGGAAAVAKRSGEKLAAGRELEALQLAEAAVAFAPVDRGALGASLAAHLALREASVNFWESSWLDREIRELEAALAG
jgi:alkyl sulfatase BDS1-like metallo-beta-lactamase superfamily hydrolase